MRKLAIWECQEGFIVQVFFSSLNGAIFRFSGDCIKARKAARIVNGIGEHSHMLNAKVRWNSVPWDSGGIACSGVCAVW